MKTVKGILLIFGLLSIIFLLILLVGVIITPIEWVKYIDRGIRSASIVSDNVIFLGAENKSVYAVDIA